MQSERNNDDNNISKNMINHEAESSDKIEGQSREDSCGENNVNVENDKTIKPATDPTSPEDDDDEVLLMNFDEEWAEDGEFVLPQPICENIKKEPRQEGNYGLANGKQRPTVSESDKHNSRCETQEDQGSRENQSQISQSSIDTLHTSQDLGEINLKLEYLSQNQGQVSHCRTQSPKLEESSENVNIAQGSCENDMILGSNIPDKILSKIAESGKKTNLKENVENVHETILDASDKEAGNNGDKNCEENSISPSNLDETSPSSDKNNSCEITVSDVIIPADSVIHHIPLQEPKVEPEDSTPHNLEHEILIKHHPLADHLLDESDNNNGNLTTVMSDPSVEPTLPYSITYQAFYTCQECQFKTIEEDDLKRHLAESHVNVVPDVSALLALRGSETPIMSETESGSNVENIDCSTPSTKEKEKNSNNTPTQTYGSKSKKASKANNVYFDSYARRRSKPNWSLRELSLSGDEILNEEVENVEEVLTKRPIGRPRKLPPKQLCCAECLFVARNSYELKMHGTFAHTSGTAPIKCLHCNFSDNRFRVWKHMMNSHEMKKQYRRSYNVDGVMQKQNDPPKRPKVKKVRCQYCSVVTTIYHYRRHLESHEIKHSTVYQCPVCPAKYLKKMLTQHIRKFHPPEIENNLKDGIYSCPKCPYTTWSTGSFECHLMSNKGLDVCDPNNKGFSPQVSGINELVPQNSDKQTLVKKRHKCTKCPFISISKPQLYRHMQLHIKGLKIIKCLYCDFWGAEKYWYVHQYSVHKDKIKLTKAITTAIKMKGKSDTYMCYKCDFKTEDLTSLQLHIEYNKNLTKCVNMKRKRSRKQVAMTNNKPQPNSKSSSPIKENVTKDKDGREIVTIDLDDIDSGDQNGTIKENVTKDKDGTEIVTIDLDDIDGGDQDDSSDSTPITESGNVVMNAPKGVNNLPVTPIKEPNIGKAPSKVSVIQDLRFYRNPKEKVSVVAAPIWSPPGRTSDMAAQGAPGPRSTKNSGIFITNETAVKDRIDLHLLQKHHSTAPISFGGIRPSVLPIQQAQGQTFKCKMCIFITNNETAIKDHIHHHLLQKHHSTDKDPIFNCQKCNFETRNLNDFSRHVYLYKESPNCAVVQISTQEIAATVQPRVDDVVIEIDSDDDENQGDTANLPPNPKNDAVTNTARPTGPFEKWEQVKSECRFCNFVAVNGCGLKNHMRFRHKEKTVDETPAIMNFPKTDKQNPPSNTRTENLPSPQVSSQASPCDPKSKNTQSKTNQRSMLPPLIPFKKTASPATNQNEDRSIPSDLSQNNVKMTEKLPISVDGNHKIASGNNNEDTSALDLTSMLQKGCSMCSFVSENLKDLQKHEESHNLKCQECDFSTFSHLVFQGHIDSHIMTHQQAISSLHATKTVTPPKLANDSHIAGFNINVTPASAKLMKLAINNQLESYACQECDYVSKSQTNFAAHRELHIKATEGAKRQVISYNIQPAAGQNISIDVYQCKECTYETNRMSELQIHQQMHQTPSIHDVAIQAAHENSYYTQQKGVASIIESKIIASKIKNVFPTKSKRETTSGSNADSSDLSDSDYKPSASNRLKPAIRHKKRKLLGKVRRSSLKRQSLEKKQSTKEKINEAIDDTKVSNTSDPSDLEELLKEKELMDRDIKKEVIEENSKGNFEDSDLENLLNYIEIKKEKPDEPKKKLKESSDVIEILTDSDDNKDTHKPSEAINKKSKTPVFMCRQCGKFSGKSCQAVRLHILEVHKNKKSFECQCGFKTFGNVMWKRHSCELKPKKRFLKNKTLTSKIKEESTTTLKCDRCPFRTVNKQRLLMHKKSGCGDTSSETSSAGSPSKKMFKCPLCFYKSGYKSNVEKHFSMCHVED